ncbi:hypothetical protein AUJ95_01390 [Candidatus Desantisbacteria bacterium CG2_30_40_21]|uniref:6-bladed beta-propeller n=5 Tax=unclassified Candidatus Desantisiibacteriota TaxID=3106372 RepID=A0A2M7JBT8_9BACT|nr:MAG: hypothetical protein AUJ95_01390 [Candidatus Desantisbacteria bacterium CG2_30_40_21]PIP39646.1 MAG: hypothetical protein COX18_09370 [Candidatus Desantisbacteria bacterium CG23_combo_of_CG06-09_8_20_14_all_40_23]PIX16885.1 MAG: hypothetical protein COZ71_06260 [Candidatus Desantisbacteria bacterium CG_4_8_14_3_um_filter_40_12]PIY19538.1 MAG: hypothetical protein COZ13_04630 [Candidatus Desantisbacteria bacterium CG_4_10_14_3_um_filter_40_18]PJB30186.1 MAG: hypothetical protein CO110_01
MMKKILGFVWILIVLGFVWNGYVMANDATNLYKSRVLIDAQWGNDYDKFGLLIGKKGQEIEPIGPLTFTVNDKENIYIFDTVNRQVKKFSAEGVYEETIAFNVYGTSICVDKGENLYILNGHTIMQYSNDGLLTNTYEISKDIDLIEGYGQNVFCDMEGNLCVNKIQEIYIVVTSVETKQKSNSKKLLSPSMQKETKKWGLPGNKLNDYFAVKWIDSHNMTIRALYDNKDLTLSRAPLKEISTKTQDSFGGVLFLGQDNHDAIYIETERITSDNYVHLEVKKYDLKGNMLAEIELPNDYLTPIYKKIAIDSQGNIYHLLTTPEGVIVVKWQQILEKEDK